MGFKTNDRESNTGMGVAYRDSSSYLFSVEKFAVNFLIELSLFLVKLGACLVFVLLLAIALGSFIK